MAAWLRSKVMKSKKIFASVICAIFLLQATPARAQLLEVNVALLASAVIYNYRDTLEEYWKQITAGVFSAGAVVYWVKSLKEEMAEVARMTLEKFKDEFYPPPASQPRYLSPEQVALLLAAATAMQYTLRAPGSMAVVPMPIQPQPLATLFRTLPQPHERVRAVVQQRLHRELTPEEIQILMALIRDHQTGTRGRVEELPDETK